MSGEDREYIAVRGSCSVNLRAANSLAHFLAFTPLVVPEGKAAFHCDEFHLHKWFLRDRNYLEPFTLIDRKMPWEFYEEMQQMIKAGAFQVIQIRVSKNGPMSSSKFAHHDR